MGVKSLWTLLTPVGRPIMCEFLWCIIMSTRSCHSIQAGDCRGKDDGYRLQHLDIPISGHNAGQRWSGFSERARLGISPSDHQTLVLWYQACLCL